MVDQGEKTIVVIVSFFLPPSQTSLVLSYSTISRQKRVDNVWQRYWSAVVPLPGSKWNTMMANGDGDEGEDEWHDDAVETGDGGQGSSLAIATFCDVGPLHTSIEIDSCSRNLTIAGT